MAVLLAIVSASLVLAACSGSGSDGGAGPSPDDQLAIGEATYQASCAACHGTDLRGTDRGPSHLSIVYEPGHHGDDAFRVAIANGAAQHHWNFGPMPPVPGLSDEEVEAVIAYVRDQQRQEGFETP
ncbi:MAG: cytochrome c [Acidimicrobiales bacterium]|nr:cytochrome c [Acidimicrobiales bacterium]